MKRLAGILMVAMGVGLAAWIVYSLFVERLPEAQDRSPIPAIVFAVALLGVGGRWVMGSE